MPCLIHMVPLVVSYLHSTKKEDCFSLFLICLLASFLAFACSLLFLQNSRQQLSQLQTNTHTQTH